MSDLSSLLFYLLSFSGASLLMLYGTKRGRKSIIAASLLIPILVGALRYQVGTDYPTYVDLYHAFSSLSMSDYFALQPFGLEMGMYLISRLTSSVASAPYLMFAVFSTLTVVFFYLGMRRYTEHHYAMLFFLFLMVVFPISFNLVRQGLAISIVFYAFSFIMDRRVWRYVVWMLVAALFHKSVLVLMPIYFLVRFVKPDRLNHIKFIMSVGLAAVVIYVAAPFVFNALLSLPIFSKYDIYQAMPGEGDNKVFYLKAIMLVAVLFLYSRIADGKHSKYFLIFVVFELVLTSIGFDSAFLKRIALYFALFSPLLLVRVPGVFRDNFGRIASYILLILYGLLSFYLTYYVLEQANLMPYRFIGGFS